MASAHYKQAWVLRSNPELLMTSWKPLIPTPQTTAPVRRVYQNLRNSEAFLPRDNAPGFISENPRSFLLPKYTYHDGSDFAHHNTSAPHTPPVTTTSLPLATPPRHPVGPPPPYPPPRSPIGNLPTTPPPATQGNFGQSSGIQKSGPALNTRFQKAQHQASGNPTDIDAFIKKQNMDRAIQNMRR